MKKNSPPAGIFSVVVELGRSPRSPKKKEKKKEEEEERRERRRRRETTYQQSKRHCLGGNEFTPGSMQQIRTARRAEPSVMRIEPGERGRSSLRSYYFALDKCSRCKLRRSATGSMMAAAYEAKRANSPRLEGSMIDRSPRVTPKGASQRLRA